MNVDRPLVTDPTGAPCAVQNLAPGQGSTGVFDEEPQQSELAGGQ
jgi:hypothetical protein